jgi:hypothetical protein
LTAIRVYDHVTLMRSLFGILLQTLRHAAVGVAVVSVLMMTLRVHLHAQIDDGHGHGVELSLGGALDDVPGTPANPDAGDPDGCGYCHCPASSVMIADIPAFVFHNQVAGLARLVHPAAAPDSLSYPPDPPPIRLS